ncbi:MAG TPA: YceI family protein [Fluviicola sp.]|nr:YceI family protein [Fluviicola sp.]
MRHFTIITLALSTLLIMAACSQAEIEKTEETAPEKTCTYTYDHQSSVMEWTAFKFIDRTEVKGTFTRIIIKDGGAMNDPKRLIQSLSFSIPISTIETQNPERDAKIAKYFFGTAGIETIQGTMKELKDNGTAMLEITINDITKNVTGMYTLEDGDFTLNATIDIADWNLLTGLEALDRACSAQHKDPGGASKLWSDVDLLFKTTLHAECE